jgi:hypothetical protein
MNKPLLQRVAVATVATLGVLGVLSTSAQQLPPPTFRSGVRLVEVDVEVRDKDDRFVETLTKDDFEVLEDGVPRQIQQVWAVNLASGRKTDPPGRFYLTGALQLDTFSPRDYQLLVEVNTRKGIPANASRAMPFTVRDAAVLSLKGAKP